MSTTPKSPSSRHAVHTTHTRHAAQDYPIHPYFKRRKIFSAGARDARKSSTTTWSVPDLTAAYNWPTNIAGGGVIAIIELGGGWVQSDMDAYFQSINQPTPSLTDVSVDGTNNDPNQSVGSDDDPDYEVALDIQVAGASYYAATGQAATIRVYWSQDIASAVQAATSDAVDVITISWGADEATWGTTAAQQMESAATAATAAGIIVFAAAGDNDSSDGGSNAANVDLPASCPHVIGCGGTFKTQTSETVWNDNPGDDNGSGTGGGYSTIFPVQSWQTGAPLPPANTQYGTGRMVPDVSADADPNSGYQMYVHGAATVVGGTSAVAPLYAGLFASFGTKLGFVTPTLWANQSAFTDITEGNNGYYDAATGPDPCTGLGVPIGTALAALFTSSTSTSPTPPTPPDPPAPPTPPEKHHKHHHE
ncbi:S53 family peptidase [Terracidiphilus gabretensis]|jgi:kumamolisin|uniref:S53 family peptidase n=1 Tax=Terracidiphilus gabretensis TaxID=1577687 RepID=UPI00071B1686|nr:S53 family peptidase [Terracidiphilus gabretensis]